MLLTLAIGIGANTAIFAFVNALLLRPLPFPNSQELVTFWGTAPDKGLPVVNYPDALYDYYYPDALYDYYSKRLRAVKPMAMYSGGDFTFSGRGEPERLNGAYPTADFFRGANSPLVAIIDQSTAARYWPRGNPIGARISVGSRDNITWRTIVGVVASIRHQQLDRAPDHYVYGPMSQIPVGSMDIVVRSPLASSAAIAALRRTMRELDSSIPVYGAHSLGDAIDASLATRRMTNTLMACFRADGAVAGRRRHLWRDGTQRRSTRKGVRGAIGVRCNSWRCHRARTPARHRASRCGNCARRCRRDRAHSLPRKSPLRRVAAGSFDLYRSPVVAGRSNVVRLLAACSARYVGRPT